MWTLTEFKGVASTWNPKELTSSIAAYDTVQVHGNEQCNESYNKNRENNKTRNRNRTRIRNRTRTRTMTRSSTPGALGQQDTTCTFDHVSV